VAMAFAFANDLWLRYFSIVFTNQFSIGFFAAHHFYAVEAREQRNATSEPQSDVLKPRGMTPPFAFKVASRWQTHFFMISPKSA
jgi:hypothetical protein